MHLPPSYMNYGQPQPVQYASYQPRSVQYVSQPRVQYVQQPSVQYVQQPRVQYVQQQPVAVQQVKPVKERNLFSLVPLWLIRLLLILLCIGVLIASALVRNNKFKVDPSSFNNNVWITTLVFGCVGFAACLLFFILVIAKAVWKAWPLLILMGLFDLGWSAAMIILGSFCAHREKLIDDIRFSSINKALSPPLNSAQFGGMNRGAFGSAAAFALLAGVVFFVSALLHIAYALRIKKYLAARRVVA